MTDDSVNDFVWEENAEVGFVKWFNDFYGEFSLRSEWFYGDCEVEDEKTRKDLMYKWIHSAYVSGYELAHKTPQGTPDALTLTDIVYRWWGDVFTTHSDWDMETSISNLVDQVEQWLPKQTDVCEKYSYETGRNHVLDVIKKNLR